MKVTPKLSPGHYKCLYHISNSCRDILPKSKRRLNLLVAIESKLVLSKSEGFILPLMCLYIQGKFKSVVLDICHSRPQWRTRHPHPFKHADAVSENALVFCLSWGLLASNLRSGLIIFCFFVMCFFFWTWSDCLWVHVVTCPRCFWIINICMSSFLIRPI